MLYFYIIEGAPTNTTLQKQHINTTHTLQHAPSVHILFRYLGNKIHFWWQMWLLCFFFSLFIRYGQSGNVYVQKTNNLFLLSLIYVINYAILMIFKKHSNNFCLLYVVFQDSLRAKKWRKFCLLLKKRTFYKNKQIWVKFS